jgi:hypothetical protein
VRLERNSCHRIPWVDMMWISKSFQSILNILLFVIYFMSQLPKFLVDKAFCLDR